jgi:hypothetical protein
MSERDDRRAFPRVHLNPDLQLASLSPLADDKLALPVLDLSPGGAAVLADTCPDWLDGRTELALRAGNQLIPCRVLDARPSFSVGSRALGLRLGFDKLERHAVANSYHKLRFAALQRRGALRASALQQLFVESGYLALKSDLVPSATWLRADWPNRLTHEAVYVARDERPLGHVTVTRAYPRAWLGHEIATVRDHSEALACRRVLYQHFSVWPRLLDGEAAHLLGYYNRSRPWHRRMFEDFAATSRVTDCAVVPMDRYVTQAIGDTEPAELSNVTVGGIEHGTAVARIISDYWPALARHAFDIAPDRLATECMHSAYRDLGLTRSRTVLVLTVKGEVVGAALCEWTDCEISLFNVLNMAHVFLARGSDLSPDVSGSLVHAVRAFYAARGAPPPIIACPPGTFKDVALTGCVWTETMGCIIWNGEGLRLFEQYVDRVLSEPAEKSP